MNYTLHKTSLDFVITSDEKLSINDLIISGNISLKKDWNWNYHIIDTEEKLINFTKLQEVMCNDIFPINVITKKVICRENQIDFSALNEIDKKKIGWIDVEKIALELYPVFLCKDIRYPIHDIADDFNNENRKNFILGFQKAQTILYDNMFNESDMISLLEICKNNAVIGTSHFIDMKGIEFIKSISKKQWKVELETEIVCCQQGYYTCEKCEQIPTPKLTYDKIKILKLI
jgi:hypothetical protein